MIQVKYIAIEYFNCSKIKLKYKIASVNLRSLSNLFMVKTPCAVTYFHSKLCSILI